MKYQGNLVIKTQADANKYAKLTEVTGFLSIYSNAKLDAPVLTSVGGDLSIYSNAKLDAPVLTSVGGDLYINSNAKLDAPVLTSVGGDLSIYSNAKLDAPVLTSVGGFLSIYSNAKLDAPVLTSVGGDLYINSNAKLDAPVLTSVGGFLSIYSNAKLDAPVLTSVGGDLYINSSAKLDASKLYPKGFDAFKVYDNIACVVLSSKKKGNIEILSCRQAKIRQKKIVGEKLFVAKKGNETAHANDLKTALEELAFKLCDRNIDQYRNMPINTRKSPEDWAFVYRMVTGACQYGTTQFMESKGKMKRSYTLAEILQETAGAYGHDKFKSVVACA